MKGYKVNFIVLILLLVFVFIAEQLQAASLVEYGVTDYKGFSVHDYLLTMDSGGATAEATSAAINGVVIAVETDPGTTAPTANYDLTITNPRGVDIMGGALSNRSATATEIVPPTLGYASEVPTFGILTIRATAGSQLVKNATVRLRIFTRDEKKGVLTW